MQNYLITIKDYVVEKMNECVESRIEIGIGYKHGNLSALRESNAVLLQFEMLYLRN